jgi:hypothetical protein
MSRIVALMWTKIGIHRVLVGKPEGKRSLGGPRQRWEENIKTDLRNIGSGHTMNWSSSL